MGPLHRIRTAAALMLVLLSLVLSLADAPADVLAQRVGQDARKVMVDSADQQAAAQLARQGGILLVDYGAFSLWSVPEASTTATAQSNEAAQSSVTAQDESDTIRLRGGRSVDTKAAAQTGNPTATRTARASLEKPGDPGGQLWLVQFIGPIKESWLDELRGGGIEPVMYMPQNAYVVWGDGPALSRLAARAAKSPVIQFTGAYDSSYRLAPELEKALQQVAADAPLSVTVQVYATKSVDQSLARLRTLGARVYRPPSSVGPLTNISLDLPAGQIRAVAGWADVFNVEPWVEPRKLDEAQGQILAGNLTTSGPNVVPVQGSGAYLSWLASKGFPTTPTSYPVVAVVDDGIDNGSTNPLHPDFHELGVVSNPSRLVFNLNCTADPGANGAGGHGNLNASIPGGYNNLTGSPHQDSRGFHLDLGVSPYGRLAGAKIYRNAAAGDTDTDFSACGNTIQGAVRAIYNAGAGLTSNSWGWGANGAYDATAQAYDALTRDASAVATGNQQMLHVFAAGNDGSLANTIDAPASAKNVLTVGATENVRDEGSQDGCGNTLANNADDLAAYSSRGPTDDGRVKPDLMAPGTHIQGAASKDAGYDGHSLCGAPGNQNSPHLPGTEYYPGGQTLYTWGTGTSHAAPAVTGAASLAYNYYGRVLNPGQTPSPSMLKALLINSARYLNGSGAGGSLPSNAQGWGDVNAGTLFDGTPRALVDQTTLFTASGQDFSRIGTVGNSSRPFRVTLVWTDAPGSTTGNAYVNDLDLEVTIGGSTYRGNVFSGAYSIAGGIFDPRDNVESVFLPPGTTGAYTVRVIARNITGDGVPGNGSVLDQDFALVVSNGNLTTQAVLSVATTTIDDTLGNGNGAIDPGETISMQVGLTNIGSGNATGVNGTLDISDRNVSVATSSSAYPNVAANATARNSAPYTFTLGSAAICGTQLSFRQTVTYNGGQTVTNSLPMWVGRAGNGTALQRTSTDTPLAIPDFYGPGVSANIPISGVVGTVADVNVRVSLTHTWDDDLVLLLISPAGTVVALSNRHGSDNDSYINTIFDDEAATPITAGYPTAWPPFTGSYRPESPLSVLRGETINGTWKLKVVDVSQDDGGTITAFGLDIVPASYQCNNVSSGPDLSLTPSHNGAFGVGQNGTYTLTVHNGSTAATTTGAITVTDTLPSGLSYVSAGGIGWTCGAAGQTVACTSPGPLQPGASSSITLTVAVGQAAAGGVTNTASVSTLGDVNPGNNGASDPTSVNRAAAEPCAPRPNVNVAVTRGTAGQLTVTVSGGAAPIQQVHFQLSSASASHTAAVDVPRDPAIASLAAVGLSNQTADFTLQVGAPQLTFVVRRLTTGSYTVPLVVTDACGDWPTFVGSGS